MVEAIQPDGAVTSKHHRNYHPTDSGSKPSGLLSSTPDVHKTKCGSAYLTVREALPSDNSDTSESPFKIDAIIQRDPDSHVDGPLGWELAGEGPTR